MNDVMDLRRRTLIAAFKLAVVISTIAALAAIAVSSVGEVPPVAIVVPVILVAFASSWVQTGRVHRRTFGERRVLTDTSRPLPTA